MSPEISRRSVATGAAWAVPTVTVLAAAPSMAASGSASTALTGVTGYKMTSDPGVMDGGTTCTTSGAEIMMPNSSSKNPSPYMYASTGVSLGAATGTQVSMTIELYDTYDQQNSSSTAVTSRLGFIPGTYTYTNSSGNALTATSTCASTNSVGACTSITLSWKLSGTGTTADNPQDVPFRVGMLAGTTIPSGDSISTGFDAPVFGDGTPDNVQSNNDVEFDAGTYTGSPTCPSA